MSLTTVFAGATGMALVRFIMSGTQSKFSKDIPNVFSIVAHRFAKPGKELKMYENMWYGLWHTISFLVTASICFPDTVWFWQYMKGDVTQAYYYTDIDPSPAIDNLYLLQIMFWTSCLMYCFLETWRSDTKQMIAHHIFTLTLLITSYSHNLWRVGIVVFFVHDISDILLYWAKTFSYSIAPAWFSDNFFIAFAVSFFFTRNILFPYYCIYPCSYMFFHPRSTETAILRDGSQWARRPFHICNIFSIFLECLHIFWLSLIVKMAKRQIFSGKKKAKEEGYVDERSEDEEDGSAEQKNKKPKNKTIDSADANVNKRK